jgi:hypothetical protein
LQEAHPGLPESMMAHSFALCQCSSRNEPAVRRMLTPQGRSTTEARVCVT